VAAIWRRKSHHRIPEALPSYITSSGCRRATPKVNSQFHAWHRFKSRLVSLSSHIFHLPSKTFAFQSSVNNSASDNFFGPSANNRFHGRFVKRAESVDFLHVCRAPLLFLADVHVHDHDGELPFKGHVPENVAGRQVAKTTETSPPKQDV